MKQRFGKLFVLIPIGIFLISSAMIAMKMTSTSLPDSLIGMIFGIGIGLELLPFILSKKVKEAN